MITNKDFIERCLSVLLHRIEALWIEAQNPYFFHKPLLINHLNCLAMKNEFVLPQGVKIVDDILYFGDRQVSFNGEPYKFAHIPTMAKMFAVRYTNEKCSYPTLCTTLDLYISKEGSDQEPLIWLSGVRMVGEKYLPSAYYSDWKSVEYVLTTFSKELQDSDWFIEVGDINDEYAWDEEKGVFRKQMKIETVEYMWADE
jgi:hypothetical protein